MVGVPGRSKACNTCRKRRIACSLDTPACKQCIKSNRECGGYQRERMWVPNNQVKLDGAPLSTPSPPSGSSGKTIKADKEKSAVAVVWKNGKSSRRCCDTAVAPLPRLTRMVDSYRSVQQQLLGEFMHSFVPDCNRRLAAKEGTTWLMFVPALVEIPPALETSLLAISSARLGRANDCPDLILESRRLYCQSLRELGKALKDPDVVYNDETLAACTALSLYEVMECPSENDKGLVTHTNGCMRLVEARGPEAHTSDFGHQLFLACRYNSVRNSHCIDEDEVLLTEALWKLMYALTVNRSNFMSKPEWMNLPWKGKTKTLADRFMDVFIQGLTIIEAAQSIGDLKTPASLQRALKVVDFCWQSDTALRLLLKELEDSISGPLFWPELSTYDNPADDDVLGKVFPVAFHFVNFRVARICTIYWSICIILWGGLFHLYQALAFMQPLSPPIDEDGTSTTTDEDCNCTTSFHICGHPFSIADLPPLQDRDVITAVRNICQSFEYCIRPDNGGLGAASIAFPLQVAIASLKEFPEREREIWWARAAVEVIDGKGFRILRFAPA